MKGKFGFAVVLLFGLVLLLVALQADNVNLQKQIESLRAEFLQKKDVAITQPFSGIVNTAIPPMEADLLEIPWGSSGALLAPQIGREGLALLTIVKVSKEGKVTLGTLKWQGGKPPRVRESDFTKK